MRPHRLIALAALSLLAACQMIPGGQPERLAPQRITWEASAKGCSGERCSLVNVDTLHFPTQTPLDDAIEHALLAMTREGPDGALSSSLRGYADDLLRRAPEGRQTWLQAKLIDQHGDLAVIELSSYLYSGGAHGMPGRGFLHYSLGQQRLLALDELLLPGAEDAFWLVASEAHRRWLKAQQLDGDTGFRYDWPFQRTRNVALLEDRVLLKYEVYTLGPYSMGHPTLEIPYSRLRHILRPQYLPDGPAREAATSR